MAITLLYRVSADGTTRTPVFEVDNVVSAGTTSEVQLTDNPVEDGSVITDHEAVRPDAHEVEVLVTDRPMSGEYLPGRAVAAWQTLKELRRSREMLVLVLPLVGDQLSVRLLRAAPTINIGTGDGVLRCTLTFREVQVATSQRVPAQRRKQTNAKPKVELGQQSTVPADDVVAERSRTVTKQILVGLGIIKDKR